MVEHFLQRFAATDLRGDDTNSSFFHRLFLNLTVKKMEISSLLLKLSKLKVVYFVSEAQCRISKSVIIRRILGVKMVKMRWRSALREHIVLPRSPSWTKRVEKMKR